MKLVVLTHYITSYRISTFVALGRKVDLTLLLSSSLSDPKLNETGLNIRILPSLLIQRRRRHPNGYIETYQLHIPRGVYGALEAIDPDVIHAHEFGLRTLMATVYKTVHRKPMVIHADLSGETERKWGVIRTGVRKIILSRTERVAVNGASGQRYIESLGFPGSRIDRLPFATDVELFSSVRPLWRTDTKRRILYVGRLIELKGLEQFIERLSEYLVERPALRAEVVIAGGGDRESAIRSMPHAANLELTMLGIVAYESLGEVYAQAGYSRPAYTRRHLGARHKRVNVRGVAGAWQHLESGRCRACDGWSKRLAIRSSLGERHDCGDRTILRHAGRRVARHGRESAPDGPGHYSGPGSSTLCRIL